LVNSPLTFFLFLEKNLKSVCKKFRKKFACSVNMVKDGYIEIGADFGVEA